MCVKLLVFQLLYQEMRKTYNAQKKPLDKMKEKVKQQQQKKKKSTKISSKIRWQSLTTLKVRSLPPAFPER